MELFRLWLRVVSGCDGCLVQIEEQQLVLPPVRELVDHKPEAMQAGMRLYTMSFCRTLLARPPAWLLRSSPFDFVAPSALLVGSSCGDCLVQIEDFSKRGRQA